MFTICKGLNSLTSLDALFTLIDDCKRHDGYQIKLYRNDLMPRIEHPGSQDYLVFANEQLVGFLGIFIYNTTIEIIGLVDPGYRQQGLCKKLLWHALSDLRKRSAKYFEIKSNANNLELIATLNKWGAIKKSSMVELQANNNAILPVNTLLSLKQGKVEDLQIILNIERQCFPFTPIEQKKSSFLADLENEFCQIWIAQHPYYGAIGKLHIFSDEPNLIMHNVGILPEFQNRGFAKEMISHWMCTVGADFDRPLFVEVSQNNPSALRVYQACGFTQNHVFETWELMVAKMEERLLI